MDEKNEIKTTTIINRLEHIGHFVEKKANGHIRVNGLDFWCTNEKWYNPKTGEKGIGLKKFVEMLGR